MEGDFSEVSFLEHTGTSEIFAMESGLVIILTGGCERGYSFTLHNAAVSFKCFAHLKWLFRA